MTDESITTGETGGHAGRTARPGRPRRGIIALAVALLSTPLWLVSFGGAVIGNASTATFGVCTGAGNGTAASRNVSTGGKCINTNAAGASIYPYNGYIYLPAGTTAIADVMAFHVPHGDTSKWTPVSGTYALTLAAAGSAGHTYSYTVAVNTLPGYPNPRPTGVPLVQLGFTSSGEIVSYTLTVAPDTTTYPANINSSRNQVYYYDSLGHQTGQDATNSVKFTRPTPPVSPSPSPVASPSPSPVASPSPSPVASPSPSPVASPSPSPVASPSPSPVASPSPSPVASPSPSPVASPSPSPVASPSPSPVASPSPSPVASPSPSPVGGTQGVQTSPSPTAVQAAQPAQQVLGAGVTSPNTGLDVAMRLLLSVLGVVGGLVLLASTRKQSRT